MRLNRGSSSFVRQPQRLTAPKPAAARRLPSNALSTHKVPDVYTVPHGLDVPFLQTQGSGEFAADARH